MVVTDMTVKSTHDDYDRDILQFSMVNGKLVMVDNSDGISIEEAVTRICAEKLPLSQVRQLL